MSQGMLGYISEKFYEKHNYLFGFLFKALGSISAGYLITLFMLIIASAYIMKIIAALNRH